MSLLGTPAPRPRLPSPGEALRLLGTAWDHRSALARLELEDARDHVAGSALVAAALYFLTLLSGVAFTLLVAALVWDSPHRAWWLGGLCALYAGGAAAAAWTLLHRWRTWQPLAETRAQLRDDRQCLTQVIGSVLP